MNNIAISVNPCALGEGPYYEEETGELRFVDIIKREIHTVSLEEGPGSHKAVNLEDSVGITTDIEGRSGEYIVAAKRGFAVFNEATRQLTYVKTYEDEPEMAERMFNDGAVDSRGRFWGTMNEYRLSLGPDLTLHRIIESVSIPNGMGWSPDDKTIYFTDSPTRGIFAYNYDADSGEISNKRVFFQLCDKEGVPDGCTIDTEGHLWVAVHEGSRVIRISPQGEVVSQITLPAWKVTCPTFGGPDFNEFITTAGVDAGEKTPNGSRDHGNMFRA
ncbi:putative anterior fat body protein [Trichophaea hybrida]|nr:putative anterior fat body protein [Trichophaea hybrida]